MVKRKTHSEFINEIENKFPGKYEILSQYVNNKTVIKVKCLVCNNIYDGRPINLLRGDRCPFCVGNKKLDTDDFKNRVNIMYPNNEYIVLGQYINSS